MNQKTDEQYMLDYQKGDQSAFEFLLTKHQNGIYNFLYRMMGHGPHLEEAFQEVFVRVIRSRDSYTPTAKFSTWIYTIARNYCIDFSRKKKFRHTISLNNDEGSGDDDSKISLMEKIPDEKPSQSEEVAAKRLQNVIDEALNLINPDQKEVFLLRHKQGLAFDEIAQIVDASVNTVKSRMRYALTSLQEELKKYGYLDPKDK